jgi:hypothetical protein
MRRSRRLLSEKSVRLKLNQSRENGAAIGAGKRFDFG